MPGAKKVRTVSDTKHLSGRPTGHSWRGEESIQLCGWDSRSETWHGPNELGPYIHPDGRLLQALRSVPGQSWFGPVTCRIPGEPAARFFVLVHDLSDCAMALVYCDESKAGPAEILAVIPADRHSQLREEFAFEFLAFARFLGSVNARAELLVHDAIASALADGHETKTFVFSISSGLWPSDLDPVLSRCVEKVAATLCQWLGESPVSRMRAVPRPASAA